MENTLNPKSADRWLWSEITNEEFESRRKNETYYRIFYKEDKKDVVVYKFWAKTDDDALKILEDYCKDHADENKYFYSTSGYYMSESSDKRYDTMAEMHEDWRNSSYDEFDREYDREKINTFKDNALCSKRVEIISALKEKLSELERKIAYYENSAKQLISNIDSTDLDAAEENVMDDLCLDSTKLDNNFYELQDMEHLIRTKHNINENWDLNSHILDDLRYNLPKMISNSNGYPCEYIKTAADILGLEIDKNYEPNEEKDREKITSKAAELWKLDLKNMLNNVLGYLYFSGYGICDESDNDLIDFAKDNNAKIPYRPGTNNEIDYYKLRDITNSYWNKIWEWMKINGYKLWD